MDWTEVSNALSDSVYLNSGPNLGTYHVHKKWNTFSALVVVPVCQWYVDLQYCKEQQLIICQDDRQSGMSQGAVQTGYWFRTDARFCMWQVVSEMVQSYPFESRSLAWVVLRMGGKEPVFGPLVIFLWHSYHSSKKETNWRVYFRKHTFKSLGVNFFLLSFFYN